MSGESFAELRRQDEQQRNQLRRVRHTAKAQYVIISIWTLAAVFYTPEHNFLPAWLYFPLVIGLSVSFTAHVAWLAIFRSSVDRTRRTTLSTLGIVIGIGTLLPALFTLGMFTLFDKSAMVTYVWLAVTVVSCLGYSVFLSDVLNRYYLQAYLPNDEQPGSST